jgi:hypothetical protein
MMPPSVVTCGNSAWTARRARSTIGRHYTALEVVVQHQPSPVNRDVLEAWLRERAAHWPVSTLLHRARIVSRFLDFLVQESLITSNPVADIRAEYYVNSSKAVCEP